MSRKFHLPALLKTREPLKLGFLPVSDCAPLVFAWEMGIFEKHGLDVELHRETGLASIRDRIIGGDLDAAQAPATFPFLANLGVDSDPGSCVSAMVLSLEGNSIVVSRRLWESGARDGESLREVIYRNWGKRTFTFAVEFPFSPQFIVLRNWLLSAGIVPERQLRIITVPPGQMFATLKLGYIDGFCAGEPWTTLASQAGLGVSITGSHQIAPLHPEKILMVRQSFCAGRATEHDALIRALLESAERCIQPENATLLGELLARPEYVNAPADCLEASFSAKSEQAAATARALFYGSDVNDPSDEKASWIISHLYRLIEQNVFRCGNSERGPVLKNVFRKDLFDQAAGPLFSPASPYYSSEAMVASGK
jgi:ABC-type nitrate/sulfonate/bicarbonate transport system substrate-binding protein